MKLKDLLEQVDEDADVYFQISYPEWDWDEFDLIKNLSPILSGLENRNILCLTAVERDTFRFVLHDEEAEKE